MEFREYREKMIDRLPYRHQRFIVQVAHWLYHVQEAPSLREAWSEGYAWLEVDRERVRFGLQEDQVADLEAIRREAQAVAEAPTQADGDS